MPKYDVILVQDNGRNLTTEEIDNIACAEIKRRHNIKDFLKVLQKIKTRFGQVVIVQLPVWDVRREI